MLEGEQRLLCSLGASKAGAICTSRGVYQRAMSAFDIMNIRPLLRTARCNRDQLPLSGIAPVDVELGKEALPALSR
jgi:hypothetical protein